MQSPRVVEPLEIVEDHRPCLLPAREATAGLPIDQLGLQGGEEALRHRVVVAVAHRAHRHRDVGLLADFPKRIRGVLGPVVGVMRHLVPGSTTCDGHLERLEGVSGIPCIGPFPVLPRGGENFSIF